MLEIGSDWKSYITYNIRADAVSLMMSSSWFGKVLGQFAQKRIPSIITKFEFKLPERYKGTFIEKWGKYKHFNRKNSEDDCLLGHCALYLEQW